MKVNFKKLFLFLALSFVLMILGLGLVAPREFKVERSIAIHKPKKIVFEHLRFLKNHDRGNTWVKKDPNVKKQYRGVDGTVGFIAAWQGNNEVGVAEQEIKQIVEGARVDFEVRMEKPFKSSFLTYVMTESNNQSGPNETQVTLGMSDRMTFPINGISLFFAPVKEISKDMDDSLANLKGLLESDTGR